MREIKFRAWHHEGNKMEFSGFPLSLSFWKWVAYDSRDLASLMQYTGLKDKNGVEIYEGDVVRLRFYDRHNGETFETGTIQWHESSSGFKWIHGDDPDWNHHWLSRSDDQNREVLGNIYDYENPDLLEVPA